MKRFSIQLKNPCSENRDEMAPTELGKFCMACQKEVIDFTKMSDAEIISFFKLNKKKCGTFKSSQLNRNLYPVAQPHSQRPLKYFFASLLSLNFLGASASISIKPKTENDSVAIVVDSSIAKNDSIKLTKTDSVVVPNFFLNDSILKAITVSPFSIIGSDIVTSGVPMQMGGFILDSVYFSKLFYNISPIFFVDTIKKIKMPSKIKMPFSSNIKEEKTQLNSSTHTNKKEKPTKGRLFFQAVLTKRIFFNEKQKWFDWW